MGNLNYVMHRITAGDKIRFFEDFYGKQWIEIRPRWLFILKKKMHFRNDEIAMIKAALVERRRLRAIPMAGIRSVTT